MIRFPSTTPLSSASPFDGDDGGAGTSDLPAETGGGGADAILEGGGGGTEEALEGGAGVGASVTV